MNTDKQGRKSTHVDSCLPVVSCLWRPVWRQAFLGSFLLWAAFPPVDWWPLAWIAPIPWLFWIRLKEMPARRPYLQLTVAGFCFWMGVLHWLRLPHPATSIGWIALSFCFAFYLPVFVGLSRVAVHRMRVPLILAAPIVWTGLELARAHLLTGMSMACLGHTQYRWLGLIQLSDVLGGYGVSFVVMFVAACFARMLPCDGRRWSLRPLMPAAVLLVAVLGYGHLRLGKAPGEPGPRIALIQGSIDVEMRYDPGMGERIFKEYYGLSRKAVAREPKLDLVAWPETMFLQPLMTYDADAAPPPEYPGTAAEFQAELPEAAKQGPALMANLARSLDVPLLLGVDSVHYGAKTPERSNSAAFVARDGELLGRYDKTHLVMFGEYVPLADRFPWLQALTPLPVSVKAGEKSVGFKLGDVRIAPNICYESVLSHVIRRQVNALAAEGNEPDILINLTNDGWFWGSSELDLHLMCGVFRAVECRKPFLVAANTGFSAWIDSNGRIVDQGPRRSATVLIAQPTLDRRQSWYLSHGDWFAGVCLGWCVACAAVGFWGRRCRSVSCRQAFGDCGSEQSPPQQVDRAL